MPVERVTASPLKSDTKPRLLFIRSTGSDCAPFVHTHLHEHVKCLSLLFDVLLIDTVECDYKQLCDRYKPDLALFESGVYVSTARRRTIRNTEAFPEIPKLGLCNADAYCTTRKLFLADMYRWNIDTFFSISLSMAEYTPEISDRLFTWPNFADGDLYRDYKERKNIPLLFTGSLATHYPWRNRIYNRVKSIYPGMLCPHFGWSGERETSRTIFGEPYARLLNASRIVPSCGTIANELVRKHLEIPASRACLLAQRSAALEAAGFIDMKTCVFAEENDVVDKLDYLFAHPDELESITEQGYDLVRSKHLLRHRDQIFQWFTLHRSVGVDEKIVQPGPFQRLVIVPRDSPISTTHICASGVDRKLLQMGDEELERGNYCEAKELFIRCLNYHQMAEPCLRLVIASLLQGDAAGAGAWSSKQIDLSLTRYRASTPDPVEWAYAIVVALCRGDESTAFQYASMFPALRHSELDRARIVSAIAAGREPEALACWRSSRISHSIHQLSAKDFRTWIRNLCMMLRACGQGKISERLSSTADPAIIAALIGATPAHRDVTPAAGEVKGPSCEPVLSIRRALLRRRSYLGQIRVMAKKILHSAERTVGHFLPYHLSSVREQRFYHELETICAADDMTGILIIGAKAGNYVTGACVQGAQANPNRPDVVCVSSSPHSVRSLEKRYSIARSVRVLRTGANEAIAVPKGASIVVMDGSEIPDNFRNGDIGRPKIIVLHDINTSSAHRMHQTLTACEDYELLDHSVHRSGYSIFKAIDAGDRGDRSLECEQVETPAHV